MARQYDAQGRPFGYGQYSPFRDKPTNVAQAVAGPNVNFPAPPDRASSLPHPPSAGGPPTQLPPQAAPAAAPYKSQAGRTLGLEGFDHNKMKSGHVSPKYVFAQAVKGLGGVADNEEMLRRLKADPSGYFANARIGGNKSDKLIIDGQLDPKFEGISSFDFLRGVGKGQGGEAYQWGAEPPPGHPAYGQSKRSNVANSIFPPAIARTGMTQQAQGLEGGPAARNWLNEVLGQLNKLRY